MDNGVPHDDSVEVVRFFDEYSKKICEFQMEEPFLKQYDVCFYSRDKKMEPFS